MDDLRAALTRMEEAQGRKAADSLVRDTVRRVAGPRERRMARELAGHLVGSGEGLALEILAKVGMFLEEKLDT